MFHSTGFLILLCVCLCDGADIKSGGVDVNSRGLFPNILNLASTSVITVNATCGETGPEMYCKLVEHVFREDERSYAQESLDPQCGVCDASSADKQHAITNAIDGTNRWWQSPSLQNGKHFQSVTITVDLGQVYQVAYVIVKSAISPRPGNWILERSIDGIIYKPWQYYALTDNECWEAYGIRPTTGKPHYRSDDEVICTSFYSKLNPLESGEIHTSLVNGRPGADGPTVRLREFTKSRYVRLRLQKIRTLNADLMTLQTDEPERVDKAVTRRYFYSIKDISVGGQCLCSGHAANCSFDRATGKQRCLCKHNTCGKNCENCCPLYNQKLYQPGTSIDAAVCIKCECYGHAESCHYDPHVAFQKRSINTDGKFDGGGVCDNCKHHTTGVNCDQCEDGYFRPAHFPRNHTKPCRKCQCSGPGMTGVCVKDRSYVMEGLHPGDCFCKVGFEGKKCDRCAVGYKNFPTCEPCPCHSAGTVGGQKCEGECVCKAHVEGPRCDRCKRGFYNLLADNPDGCSQCFCFGLTDECTEGEWGVKIIEKTEEWRITDIKGIRTVNPVIEGKDAVIANDDMSQFNSYYWLAPPDYLGKKLYSYGADLKFIISYVVARGDTSGTYTESADVILEGNGMQLGHKWGLRPESDSLSIAMPLREQGWFKMLPSGEREASVSREAFTLVLNNLTRLLIRAKFHTDQIEGRLHNIGMEIASENSTSLKKLKSVEKCVCPPGYSGLSCELCASGYREIKHPDSSGVLCERCDCYNHAESCDADTGRCKNCMHHTTGVKCDRCLHGYYGDATIGTSNDCKKCACPLEDPENNFSPSCTATESQSGDQDYVCDRCPPGYDGNKCERCIEGHFGNPQLLGGYCQPCDCSDNADTSSPGWCDGLTGQCRKCLGNTGGWNCGECLQGHFGDPERRSCISCACDPHGSLNPQCDHVTGQCICKPHYIGRTCDRCAEGYGNVAAGCIPCECNIIGSRTAICEAVTGHCLCKPGVFGTRCDSCLENHYGFSEHGCRECSCHPYGSFSSQCHEVEGGQCLCKPHVSGRACDRCEDGYWNLNSGHGCEQCHCNRTGSAASLCDKSTGQCTCKHGVGGVYCDQCLPGYFKFSTQGCRKCDPCDAPGHICDPENGRCVCPPLTTGRRCQKCAQNAWGYDPLNGCKPCNCNPQGSSNQRCDPATGNCICVEGFEGRHCDQCRHGFYNFPNCNKCNCNISGTDTSKCQMKDGVCHCNDHGHCFCKENVVGKKCDKCQDDSFGLSAENKKGCHKCFCFGRTRICSQANMFWQKTAFPSQDVFMEIGTAEIPTFLGFKVIPHDLSSRRLGIPYVLDKPLYYTLPKEKLGDKVLSYNGYLSFFVESHSASHFPDALLQSYPLVILQGNQRIVLMHPHSAADSRRPYRIHLNEDEWKNLDNPEVPVKKSVFMVALQNVQMILIRATDGPDVKYSRLHNVSLDEASADFRTPSLSDGIEMCRCPRQYTSASCQDPAPGYYRKRKPNYLDSKDVLDLIGWAEPCSCNNHTKQCDKETGICINCGGNTVGNHCDRCVKGYYGDPTQGPCRPCSCPHPTNSFSDTCLPDSVDYVCIDCQVGYTGRHCERCDKGYYGNPLSQNGRCRECKCNPYGSQSRDCDQVTGQCQCHSGIRGRDCTVCNHGFILTEYGCKSCEDECTGVLLNELYEMKVQLENVNLTDLPKLPWGYLQKMTEAEAQLRPMVNEYQKRVEFGKELINNFTFYFDLEAQADSLLVKAGEFVDKAITVSSDAKNTLDEAEKLFLELNKIWRSIKDLASELDRHGIDLNGTGISTERMLAEAEQILLEIQSRRFAPDKENAERELRKAQNLLAKIKKLTRDRGHIDALKQRINTLNNLLGDVIKIVNDNVRKPAEKSEETVRGGNLRLNEVQSTVGLITGVANTCNGTLTEAADLLGQARSFVVDASVKFEYLPRLLRDLENATGKLDEHRGILASLNPLYKEKYVIPAQEHADELERQSRRLADLFVATKELSEFPLQAAKAYQNIVDAINDAEKAAQEAERAAEKAYREAYPGTDAALTAQANKARELSLKLLLEAQKLNEEDVPELEVIMRERKKDLDKLSEEAAHGKSSNDMINRELDALPTDIAGTLEGANAKGEIADAKANRANDKVNRIDHLIINDLKPRYEAIHAGSVGGLENLTKIIQQARDDVRGASRLADSADASANRVRKKNAQLQLNLKDLKDKILLARQKASSIRVALTADDSGLCFRSYKPVIEPSTTNNIVLNYAIKSHSSNSMLFFLGSAHEEDFIAIEMVNRKMRFLWNVGGGTQVLEHNMTIETNNDQLLNNEQWFKIEANRIGNLATLSVKRTPDGQKIDPNEVSGASPVGFTKMDLDSTSNLFIGGFPENYLFPNEIRTSSFAGCLYEVLLDGKPIGLWNFLTSDGCEGCKEGATEDIDISAYELQGKNSYAIVPQNPYYRKSDLYAVMNFKTLNEDALLFLSCNSKTGDLISLELKNGKVVYQLSFGGGRSKMFLETKKKYNSGNWIRVEAAREKFEAQISVDEEFLEETDAKQSGPSSLDLSDSSLYYGGVPPNFTTERWPGINFKPFFGCLRDLQIDSTPIALSSGSFYGMTVGCSGRALKVATFTGAGYLEIDAHPLSADSSFSFSFLTYQRDALLMLSTFIGLKDEHADVSQNYYSLALKDGRIEARLNSESGEISMVADNVVSIGVFHTVNMIRKNRRLLLRVDDQEEADIRLPRGARDVLAPQKGGLFFGGVRETIIVGNMAASQQPLLGIVKDVIFNDRLLRFENAINFKGVDFGLANIEAVSQESFQQMPVFHAEESCSSRDILVDNFAFSPSGSKHGFLRAEIEKKDMIKTFNVSLEFRTYYPDGLLLLAKNFAKKQELKVYLKNSSIFAEFRRRSQHKTVHSKELEVGQWHKVMLLKTGAKMALYVDHILVASLEPLKKLAFREPFYIGGAPKKTSNYDIKHYYGCIRNFHINNVVKRLPTTSQCFQKSELGSYFSGERYVVYDSALYSSDVFVLAFEFRTFKLYGDILYIYSKTAKMSLKLQIIDGQLLATVYSEQVRRKIQLSRSMTSKYEICNNNWHKVSFSYKHGNLFLKLDNMKPIDKKLEKLDTELNYVELYLGGSPRKHGSSTSHHFVGCLRNISINNELLDLRNAEDSHVVQHSCPSN